MAAARANAQSGGESAASSASQRTAQGIDSALSKLSGGAARSSGGRKQKGALKADASLNGSGGKGAQPQKQPASKQQTAPLAQKGAAQVSGKDLEGMSKERIWKEVEAAVKSKTDMQHVEAEGNSSSASVGKGFGSYPLPAAVRKTSGQPLRILLYAVDESSTRQAIASAGLSGRVEVTTDVKLCDAVVTAKLARNGQAIKSGQVIYRVLHSLSE